MSIAQAPNSLQTDAFRKDVLEGLTATPKRLPSRWLYDGEGSRLFEEITTLDEYYLSRCESAILHENASELAAFAGADAILIEYGAGAGIKSQALLTALNAPAAYVPVDIADEFLSCTLEHFGGRFPELPICPVVADFTSDFDLPPLPSSGRRIAFFAGSTIGNLDEGEAVELLMRMRIHVGEGGRALIGMDLIKDLGTLAKAYDDRGGVTAAFNLNVLRRINREIGGGIPLDAFVHEARWNPAERAIEMHLRCVYSFSTSVGGQVVRFIVGETIHTETSRKYDLPRIDRLVELAGWTRRGTWNDEKCAFAVVGLEASQGGESSALAAST